MGMVDALELEVLEGEGGALSEGSMVVAAAVAEDIPLLREEGLERKLALAGGEGDSTLEPVAAEETPALLLRLGRAVLAAGLTEGDAVVEKAPEIEESVLGEGARLLVDASDAAAVGEAGPVPMRETTLVGVGAEETPAVLL